MSITETVAPADRGSLIERFMKKARDHALMELAQLIVANQNYLRSTLGVERAYPTEADYRATVLGVRDKRRAVTWLVDELRLSMKRIQQREEAINNIANLLKQQDDAIASGQQLPTEDRALAVLKLIRQVEDDPAVYALFEDGFLEEQTQDPDRAAHWVEQGKVVTELYREV